MTTSPTHADQSRTALNTQPRTGRQQGRRSGRRLAIWCSAVVLTLTAVVAGAMAPASAFTSRTLAGRPGSIGVPATIGVYGYTSSNQMVSPNRWVWRSPASSGTQYVTVKYRMWRYDWHFGQWNLESSVLQPTVTISAGNNRALAPGFAFNVQGLAPYADDFIVTWYRPNGERIGRLGVDQNALSDYRCDWTDGYRCQVLNTPDGAGVYLGA
jgi:hypothetical protein